MHLETGEVIAQRYTLVRLIGEGGMGAVWAARDGTDQSLVAMKVLRGQEQAPELRRRFFREARAAMAVKHPNVVRIREVVTVDDEPIIVMDYLEGESLAGRLDKIPRLPLAEFARIFVPVVSAIGTAHSAGIVHRDLKPDNIFLARVPGGGEEPRVVDFGIAKLTAIEGDAKQSGHLTTTGSVLGTPYYMSPEQVFGDKSIDHRTDVWSLGTIAFECLSGRRPVDGENIGQLLKVITTGAIPRLEDCIAGLPPDVYELIGRMLSFDRAKRPYDLREVFNIFSRHTDRRAQAFGEVTLADESRPTPEVPVSPSAATLMDVPESAPGLPAAFVPGALTTGGAGAAAVTDRGQPAPPPSKSGRVAAIAAIGIALLGGGAVVGVRAMKLRPSAGSPTLMAPSVGVPTPTASAAVPVSASASAEPAAQQSAAASSSVAPRASAIKPVVAVRPSSQPKPPPSVASAVPATTTSAKAAVTGAPVATENPYK